MSITIRKALEISVLTGPRLPATLRRSTSLGSSSCLVLPPTIASSRSRPSTSSTRLACSFGTHLRTANRARSRSRGRWMILPAGCTRYSPPKASRVRSWSANRWVATRRKSSWSSSQAKQPGSSPSIPARFNDVITPGGSLLHYATRSSCISHSRGRRSFA